MEWTVRVINFKHHAEVQAYKHNVDRLPTIWIESLAHMELVEVLSDSNDREVLQFRHPNGNVGHTETLQWATECAAVMMSRGLNAVAAPKWPTGEKYEEFKPNV